MNQYSDLPFQSLFWKLKKNGFSIDVRDTIDFIALFNEFPDQDLYDYKYYLSPLVARDSREQALFYNLYDQWLKERSEETETGEGGTLETFGKKRQKIYIICSLGTLLAILIGVLCWATFFNDHQPRDGRNLINIPTEREHQININNGKSADGSETVQIIPKPGQKLKKDDSSDSSKKVLPETNISDPADDLINHDVNLPLIALISALSTGIFSLIGYFFSKIFLMSQFLSKSKGVVGNSSINKNKPHSIPFKNRDSLIKSELLIDDICNIATNHNDSNELYLDINNSIKQTINNHGVFTPAYRSKTQERSYLILIDCEGNHNQQVNLFKYIVKVLLNRGLDIAYGYFYQNPKDVFFLDESIKLPFGNLKYRFDRDILIIISNGYGLLDKSLPMLDCSMEKHLQNWENRFLITPVGAVDWKSKEEILKESITLFPADLPGWLSLIQLIEEGDTNIARKSRLKNYRHVNVEFDEIEELKGYLNDEDLFQWVCCISVHHHVRWEIIIELGHRLLKKNKRLFKLNYTNLLKITRISWITEGFFPTGIRLELLKCLHPDNEIISRKAMLEMLKDSDAEVMESSLVYKEKMMQVHTDRFIIYANDAANNKSYKADRDVFLSLWTQNYIADVALNNYLKNENREWQTPIRSINNYEETQIDQYIKDWNPNKLYWTFELFMQIVLCFLFHALILIVILRDLREVVIITDLNKIIHLIK